MDFQYKLTTSDFSPSLRLFSSLNARRVESGSVYSQKPKPDKIIIIKKYKILVLKTLKALTRLLHEYNQLTYIYSLVKIIESIVAHKY